VQLIEQSWEWILKPTEALERIEVAGRTCYKSEDKITKDSAEKFVKAIMSRGHESVIEHVNASVRFITNRGVTHELVRHRLCAFSQESTRYVRYNDVEFIKPVWWGASTTRTQNFFLDACATAEDSYNQLIQLGWRAEQAREVLPNALKTEIVVTANLREWRHIFKLRTSKAAHPQIRALMLSCLKGFQEVIPVLFDDMKED